VCVVWIGIKVKGQHREHDIHALTRYALNI